MRILCLSTWFPYPPDNGSKIRAFYLLRALADAHRVDLVAFCPDQVARDRQDLTKRLALQSIHTVPVNPFRYVMVPDLVKFCSPIPVASWPSTEMKRALKEISSSAHWDVVVAIQTPVAQYATQFPGVPGVLDVDTSMSYQSYERHCSQVHPVSKLRTWVSWQKAQKHEIRLLRGFQACTVVSSTEVDYVEALVKGSGCRVSVIPNGVDCKHNVPALAQPVPRRLVYNGALTYSANYDAMFYFLAEIYPTIRQQVPEVSLTITGSFSGVDMSGLALDESVHLSGYVEDIRVPVAEASVCVAPIRQGGGTRLKILEAMALGTPVISTSKGAEGLEGTPGQEFLIADDPHGFATQVVRLLGDGALRRQLAANARCLVEQRYDWKQIGRCFVELVEDAVAAHAHRGDAG